MKKVMYPAILQKGSSCGYVVSFKDFNEMTQGDTLEEAIDMAKECLELVLEGLVEDKDVIPEPTLPENIELEKGQFVVLIVVNISLIKNEVYNKSVKKTVTIPYWLNEKAEENRVNFSQLLQVAIKEHLNV